MKSKHVERIRALTCPGTIAVMLGRVWAIAAKKAVMGEARQSPCASPTTFLSCLSHKPLCLGRITTTLSGRVWGTKNRLIPTEQSFVGDNVLCPNHCLQSWQRGQVSLSTAPALKDQLDSPAYDFTPKWISQICARLCVIQREGRIHLWLEGSGKKPLWRAQRLDFQFYWWRNWILCTASFSASSTTTGNPAEGQDPRALHLCISPCCQHSLRY